MPRGPLITVHFQEDTGTLHLTSSIPSVPPLEIKAPSPNSVQEAQTSLRRALDEVRAATKDTTENQLQLPWGDVENAFHRLHIAGLLVASQLFGGSERARDVSRFFQSVLLTWAGLRGAPPLLQVEAPQTAMYPFEILPLFDLSKPDHRIADYLALTHAARKYVGFSMVVRRLLSRVSLEQENSPLKLPLQITFLRYAGLKGADQELRFFNAADRATIHLEGPWPSSGTPEADDLLDALFDPNTSLPGWPHNATRGMVHFACHCDTRAVDTTDYTLRMRGENDVGEKGSNIDIKLRDLEVGYLERLASSQGPDTRPRPFVFINACGSSHIQPVTGASLPAFFLREGHVGVIGTETEVRDDLAAELSGQFYKELLAGENVGTALQRAKWTILRRYRNPLVLLYTLYGNPRLKIARDLISLELGYLRWWWVPVHQRMARNPCRII